MDNEKSVKLEEHIITSYNAYAHLLALMQTWYGGTEAFQNWFVNQYLGVPEVPEQKGMVT